MTETETETDTEAATVDVRALALSPGGEAAPVIWGGRMVARVRRPTLAERSEIVAAGEAAFDAAGGAGAKAAAARLTRMTVEATLRLTLALDGSALFTAGDRQAIADAPSGGVLDVMAQKALKGLNVDVEEAGNG